MRGQRTRWPFRQMGNYAPAALWTIRYGCGICERAVSWARWLALGREGVRTLALSADGRRLATGALTLRRFPQVCLWDVTRSADNVRPVCPALPSKHHGVESLAFSPNGEMLASASPVQRTAARQTRRRWSSSTRSRSAPSCASAGVGSEPIGSGDRDESRRRSRHRELLESRSRCMGGV
jgi:WD40 repeat protein